MTEEKLADIGRLILRVGLGVVFIAHGSLKVWVFGLTRAVGPGRFVARLR